MVERQISAPRSRQTCTPGINENAWRVLQALIFCNDNPAPDEYGIELGVCTGEVVERHE